MAEALPFVRAGIPEQGFRGGAKAGKRGSDEILGSRAFAALMAQHASAPDPNKTEKGNKTSEAPSRESPSFDSLGGAVPPFPVVLDLGGALASSARKDVTEPLMAAGDVRVSLDVETFGGTGALLFRDEGQEEGRRGAAEADGALSRTEALASPSELSFSSGEGYGVKNEESLPAAGGKGSFSVDATPVLSEPGAGEKSLTSMDAPTGGKHDGPVGVGLLQRRLSLDAGAGGKPAPYPNFSDLKGRSPALKENPVPSLLLKAGSGGCLPAGDPEEGAAPSLEEEGLGEGMWLRRGETGQDSGRDGVSRKRSRTAVDAARAESAEDLPRSPARGEFRPDVQSFFDGILASRRQLQSAAGPLDLSRGTLQNPGEVLREGLENVVRFARANGEQRASLIVDPPALGRLTVELTSGTSGLEANIKVSSEQVRNLVQDQIVQLRMSLAQQGVQLAHFSVDVQQDDGRRQQSFQRGQNRRRVRGDGAAEDDVTAPMVFRVDLKEGLLHWVG